MRSPRVGQSDIKGFLGGAAAPGARQPRGTHASAAHAAAHTGAHPFSPAWYAAHPNAWHYTHPHADAVAVASATAVGAWITHGAYPYPPASSGTTVVYEAAAPEPTPADPPASNPDFMIAGDPPPAEPEWLALGAFDLTPAAGVAATHSVQLSVNRQSEVRGVCLDQLTGAVQDLSGRVDLTGQTIEWTVGKSSGVAFTAPLAALTDSQGALTVGFPSGPQSWLIARRADQ